MGLECEVGVQGLRAGGYPSRARSHGKGCWLGKPHGLKGPKLVTGLGMETELSARVLRRICEV